MCEEPSLSIRKMEMAVLFHVGIISFDHMPNIGLQLSWTGFISFALNVAIIVIWLIILERAIRSGNINGVHLRLTLLYLKAWLLN